MRQLLAGVLALSLGGLSLAWDDPKTEAKKDPPSRADRLKAVVKEYQDTQRRVSSQYFEAKDDKAKQEELQKEGLESRKKASDAAWAIMEENPKDDDGLDALIFVMGLWSPERTKKAFELITEHHVANPSIKKAIASMSRGPEGKTFLLAVLAKNPDKDAKGLACYYIGSAGLSAAEQEKDKVKQAAAEKDGLEYLERVVKDFPDTILYGKTKAGTSAAGALFAYKNLRVGLTVPEVEGEDVDGAKFKLSDYRGKVVMIDFWGHW
jgi:hypothetical protein